MGSRDPFDAAAEARKALGAAAVVNDRIRANQITKADLPTAIALAQMHVLEGIGHALLALFEQGVDR